MYTNWMKERRHNLYNFDFSTYWGQIDAYFIQKTYIGHLKKATER